MVLLGSLNGHAWLTGDTRTVKVLVTDDERPTARGVTHDHVATHHDIRDLATVAEHALAVDVVSDLHCLLPNDL
jgi:hypothetical protein